jgi:hypothetical protein
MHCGRDMPVSAVATRASRTSWRSSDAVRISLLTCPPHAVFTVFAVFTVHSGIAYFSVKPLQCKHTRERK